MNLVLTLFEDRGGFLVGGHAVVERFAALDPGFGKPQAVLAFLDKTAVEESLPQVSAVRTRLLPLVDTFQHIHQRKVLQTHRIHRYPQIQSRNDATGKLCLLVRALNRRGLVRIVVAMLTAVSHCPSAASADQADVDASLVRSAARGDIRAFENLYRRHCGHVHGAVARLVGRHGTRAEDLTQEAFVRAWQALPAFRFESSFATWMHRLAVNTALMELRSRRTRAHDQGDDDAFGMLGAADSAGHTTALSMDLARAVESLPPRARAVLVLYDVEGWKHDEIATELGMAVGSSKAQLHRARGLLRARLGEST